MDAIKTVIEPLLIFTKVIGVTSYSFTSNGVKFSKLNRLQIFVNAIFWIIFYVQQFLYVCNYEAQGD
jgi:hypothetical protein